MRTRTRGGLLFAFLIVASGCTGPLGSYCDPPGSCAEGLECVPYMSQDIVDGTVGCVSRPLCSIPCASDEECVEALGEGHICEDDCGFGACLVGSRG